MPDSKPNLFRPLKVGNMYLSHRVVHAPLTRFRTTPSEAPIPKLVKEYYSQRASTPGTLLVAEANVISPQASGVPGAPGIWSDEQIEGWKEVAEAVHAKGCYIFLQVVAVGRGANVTNLRAHDDSFEVVGPSSIPEPGPGFSVPRALTKLQIAEYISMFSTAATNAVHRAGFDGVEIHGANGHLIDQFLRDPGNHRTDEYGGSVQNRARFLLEIVEGVSKAVGEERTALRIGAWLDARGLAMKDPLPTFSYVVTEVKNRYPRLAYLHAIEPRVSVVDDREAKDSESNQFIRDIWSPRPLILAGGFLRDDAIRAAETEGVLIAFGRRYISNPDLPARLMMDLPLSDYDRSTFYLIGDTSGRGYVDYPSSAAIIEVKC